MASMVSDVAEQWLSRVTLASVSQPSSADLGTVACWSARCVDDRVCRGSGVQDRWLRLRAEQSGRFLVVPGSKSIDSPPSTWRIWPVM